MKSFAWIVFSIGCGGTVLLTVDSYPPNPTSPTLHTSPEDATDTGVTTPPDTSSATPPPAPLPELLATPPGAAFVDSIEVSLQVLTQPDALIWYTLDGTPPHAGTSALYTDPLVITESSQLRATASVDGDTLGTAPTFVALEPSLDGFSSDLPLAVLWSEGSAPVTKREEYNPYSLSVFEPQAHGRTSLPSNATLSVRAGLRVRGSSSSSFDKKPYRLEAWDPVAIDETDLNIPLLGMPADADWVFLSPLVFDRAFMRNALMYELSNNVGRYAPRTAFVEAFVAERGETVGLDDYVGIYVVVERVERNPDRVAITQMASTDVEHPEVSGGYIFKEDRVGEGELSFTAGTASGVFDFEQPFVIAEPKSAPLPDPQFNYLTDLVDELGVALASIDFIHPTTGRHYDEIVDVSSFIDHHILNVFSKNPDSFRLSGYFFKDREESIHAGPLWDFDRTLGCADDSRALNPTWWDASNETNDCTFVFEHGFWLGFFRDPVFQHAYWARWHELLSSELSVASVHEIIDRMASELAEAAPRNFAEWSGYPPRGGNFDGEVSLLKDWVADRHAWATSCLLLSDPQTCMGN